ncbi:MAG: L-2-hydroxyglutarate oxidase [Bacteroidetes bacterium]|nr:L-2-hydroxyglutarate oxidase [Bacteroidota bacterium]
MYDVIIAGGGIVGLATAYQLQQKKPDLNILLLEKENDVAQHQTGNNSGVIHSGLYYKPGSLKATNCLRGYQMLLEFCDAHSVQYDLCGKLVVATHPSEVERLKNLHERGIANGLSKIKKLSGAEIREYEPHAKGLAALHVPYTGIIDFREVSYKLKELIIQQGGNCQFNQGVTNIQPDQNGSVAIVKTTKEVYKTRLFINTCGLLSDRVANLAGKQYKNVRIIPFRGEYVTLKPEKEYLVKNLIYPVPDPRFPFLGVHFTRMIRGGIEAGPNAVWAFKREGYKKNSFSFKDFTDALRWPGFHKVMRDYWQMGLGEYYRSYNKKALNRALQKLVPELSVHDLQPGGAGVRAQACDKKGGLIDDFLFAEESWAIHVLNAPSPAATSSLSIGAHVAHKALSKL